MFHNGKCSREIGCSQARLVIVDIYDTPHAETVIRAIRAEAPDVPLIALIQYEMDRDSLQSAGASEVVTVEATASSAIVETCFQALAKAP